MQRLGPRRRVYVFADESGDPQFDTKCGSRHFILATVTALSCDFGARLLDLRREMAWEGTGLNEEWHATKNSDAIRGRVFEALATATLEVDVTVFAKEKVAPYYRDPPQRFYEFAWYWHFGNVAPRILDRGDELFVVSASLGTKNTRKVFHLAVENAVGMHVPGIAFRTAHWRDDSDPCLIAADYVAWAIFRKREMFMPHYYNMIKHQIRSEVDFFSALK